MLQTFSNFLKCKYGFLDSKLWKVARSWMTPDLKLKHDGLGKKKLCMMLLLVQFKKSLSIIGWSWIFCSAWLSPYTEELHV